MGKLNADDYREIKKRMDAGQTYKDIAAHYKVSPAEAASFLKKMAELEPMLEEEAEKPAEKDEAPQEYWLDLAQKVKVEPSPAMKKKAAPPETAKAAPAVKAPADPPAAKREPAPAVAAAPKASAAPEKAPKASPAESRAAWKALGKLEMLLEMMPLDKVRPAVEAALHDIETALKCA